MPYTLWSRGRLLGESDLGFPRVFANHQMGWFHPSPEGDRLMPILTGPGPALRAVGKLMRHPMRQALRQPDTEREPGWPPDIRSTTEYADLVSSVDELESMQLQVRDSDGAVVEIDHVGIDDTEFKISLLPRRFRRDLKPEPWQVPAKAFPRYQIQVYLAGSALASADDVNNGG